MPIRTYQALKALGLTDRQATAAWDIILNHLGIVSPHGPLPKPTLPPKVKPKHKAAESKSGFKWRRESFLDDDVWDAEPDADIIIDDHKPKDIIPITTMINAEVQRLKTAPVTESPTDDTDSPIKIIRKKDRQW
jgi:hypothetical protein